MNNLSIDRELLSAHVSHSAHTVCGVLIDLIDRTAEIASHVYAADLGADDDDIEKIKQVYREHLVETVRDTLSNSLR